MAAHQVIIDGLCRLTPQWPVLSEEAADIPWSERSQWPTYWLVDPLDGTREFIKRNGEFTVNIALIEQNEPVFGVVHAPVTGETWHARQGRNAYRRVGDVDAQIRTRAPATGTLKVAASRSHRAALNSSSISKWRKIQIIIARRTWGACKSPSSPPRNPVRVCLRGMKNMHMRSITGCRGSLWIKTRTPA